MNSVILEPKYPILNTNDGYCIRTKFEGCVTTTPNGELISKGKILRNIIIEGKDSKKERGGGGRSAPFVSFTTDILLRLT